MPGWRIEIGIGAFLASVILASRFRFGIASPAAKSYWLPKSACLLIPLRTSRHILVKSVGVVNLFPRQMFLIPGQHHRCPLKLLVVGWMKPSRGYMAKYSRFHYGLKRMK